jgi:hypothetical protein
MEDTPVDEDLELVPFIVGLRGRETATHGVIVAALSPDLEHRALVGRTVVLTSLHREPNVMLRGGYLVRANLLADVVREALAAGGPDQLPIEGALMSMREPCARVPISLLRALRGQQTSQDQSRLALISLFDREV